MTAFEDDVLLIVAWRLRVSVGAFVIGEICALALQRFNGLAGLGIVVAEVAGASSVLTPRLGTERRSTGAVRGRPCVHGAPVVALRGFRTG